MSKPVPQHSPAEVRDLRRFHLSRRKFLRGLGACVALPALESLRPSGSLLAEEIKAGGNLAVSPTGAPLRMAFAYFPNGAIPDAWWPTGEGKDFELARTMKPLEKVKHQVQVVSGLDHKNATPGPDGAGDHARAAGTFLTGVRVRKTAGADINANISIDQVAANQIGHLTRFPSLELTCDAVRKAGSCDSGYSCAYQYNLAWKSPTQPLAPEPNPKALFERLFGVGEPGQRRAYYLARQQQQQSILDFVMEDARAMDRQLSLRDHQKLDEYLNSVREVEKRISSADKNAAIPDPEMATPAGVPGGFAEHIKIMFDMVWLAFQTDSTRLATFILAADGNNRAFPELEIPEGHHYLTHHKGNAAYIEKVRQIEQFYMQQVAYFLEKMEETKDADGTSLLHNTMFVYGCGNADGNRHTHNNLPILAAGSAGGQWTAGRSIKLKSQPMSNFLLSMVDRLGIQGPESFGDSTGRATGF